MAPPPPRSARTRPCRAGGSRWPPGWRAGSVPWRTAPSPRRAVGIRQPALQRGADQRNRRGRDRRPTGNRGRALHRVRPRGVAQAPRPDRDRARGRPPRDSPWGNAPKAISVRDQRTRWGSASRLGGSPSRGGSSSTAGSLETVVIHRLAHLRVFGHGPRFWAFVASRRPDTPSGVAGCATSMELTGPWRTSRRTSPEASASSPDHRRPSSAQWDVRMVFTNVRPPSA